jgi:D-3-phosphoglycerate dehydrogenase
VGIEVDVPDIDESLSKGELREFIDEYCETVIGFVGLDGETIEASHRLKVISQWRIGLDALDLNGAEANDVAVYNIPGAFAEKIADVVIAYLMMLARDLHYVARAVRDGEWPSQRGTSLRGRTLGTVGVGNIGEAFARRALRMVWTRWDGQRTDRRDPPTGDGHRADPPRTSYSSNPSPPASTAR